MCWSGEASAVLASVGLGSTLYAAYKKEPPALWVTLGYFSLMELLQAFTYSVIDRCELPSNQISTIFGYLHIAFQPFFINAMAMHFIQQDFAKKIAPWVYAICFCSAIMMILQLYPFEWAGHCAAGRTLCAERLCSFHGEWHIAWDIPTNGIFNWSASTPARGFPTYLFAGLILPALYGSWRLALYHALAGPALAHFLSQNNNERPAIWCLLSIGILLIVVKTPVRKYLYVKNWPLWKKEEKA